MSLERTVENLRQAFPMATDEDLQRYIDLRDEGYSAYVAQVMAGLRDPEGEAD